MTLFYDLHLAKDLRDIADQLRARFEVDFINLCHRLGSANPTVDAAILLGEVQRLEYQGLAAGGVVTRDQLYRQLNRLIRWIMSV